MSFEALLEQNIQEKGLTAPRLTPEYIDSLIVGETYTNLPDGRTIICQLQLNNGCSVEGKSACASVENFNQEVGNSKARYNAREHIWELEGYHLRARLPKSLSIHESVRLENKELYEKYKKLESFLSQVQPETIGNEHWELLNQQLKVMAEYRRILIAQLDLF